MKASVRGARRNYGHGLGGAEIKSGVITLEIEKEDEIRISEDGEELHIQSAPNSGPKITIKGLSILSRKAKEMKKKLFET